MLTVCVGSCMLWISFACVDAGAICPKGVWKTFMDGLPVWINGSPGWLQWDVAPESAIVDGICSFVACVLSLWSGRLCVVFYC